MVRRGSGYAFRRARATLWRTQRHQQYDGLRKAGRSGHHHRRCDRRAWPVRRSPEYGRMGQNMRLSDCHNVEDFRTLARKRLPGPVYHYIDGAADDETTKARNTTAFDDCDLVPRVLAGVETIDMST